MKKYIILTLFGVIGIAFISCVDSTDWYPTGNVEILKYRVYDTPEGLRNCSVFYKINNTGVGKINQSTVSLTLETDKGSYLTTVVNTTVILPGKSIYGSVDVTFFDNTEVLDGSDSIVVTGYFFE